MLGRSRTSVVYPVPEVNHTTAKDSPFVNARIVPCLHQSHSIVLYRSRWTTRLQLVRRPWCLRSGGGFKLCVKVGSTVFAGLDGLKFYIWEDADMIFVFLICWSGIGGRGGLDVEHAVQARGGHVASPANEVVVHQA